MTVPFPAVWDDSMLSEAKACRYKFWLKYLNHWKPVGTSIHLHAGKAWAHALEAARREFWERNQELPILDRARTAEAYAIRALLEAYGPPDSYEGEAKSLDRMLGALEFYFERYPLPEESAPPCLRPDGRRAIEYSSVDPLELDNPETGYPLLYSTRADQLVDYGGGVYVEDDKTTSSLGASWANQWDLRSQFIGYTWAAGRQPWLIGRVRGCLVRGVSILKTKYDTQQAIVNFAPWEVDEWYSETLDLILELIRDWKRGIWRKDRSKSCTDWGGCDYRTVCKSSDPAPWLQQFFERKMWDPVYRVETLLDA